MARADIERVVARYRARLAALEADVARRVGPARVRALRDVQQALDVLLASVDRSGLPADVTRRWVTDLDEYRALVVAAERGMDDVATEAVRAIQWSVAEAAQMGPEAANALTAATIGESGAGATGLFGQVNAGAMQQLVGALQASSPLVALPALGQDAVARMTSELVRGLANGTHSRTIGRRIAQATGMPAARAATIARTEIHRAYREANRLAYQANPMVSRWRWLASLGPRTCSACWSMHGTVHDTDEPMGSHPNCRCSMVPVVDTSRLRALGLDVPDVEWASGEERFAAADEGVQRAVLGPAKFEAYREGRITLADTVAVRESAEWGTTRSTASLADALGVRAS